jgi:hypothetical protein
MLNSFPNASMITYIVLLTLTLVTVNCFGRKKFFIIEINKILSKINKVIKKIKGAFSTQNRAR